MEGVADEGGGPAEEDAAETFFGEDGTPGGDVGCVDIGVDLAATFYLVERDVSWCCWSRKQEGLGLSLEGEEPTRSKGVTAKGRQQVICT